VHFVVLLAIAVAMIPDMTIHRYIIASKS